MKGVIEITNDDGETHRVELDKKDIKTLKTLVIELEKEYIRAGLQGQKLKKAVEKDRRIGLLDRIVNNQIVWYKPWLDENEENTAH